MNQHHKTDIYTFRKRSKGQQERQGSPSSLLSSPRIRLSSQHSATNLHIPSTSQLEIFQSTFDGNLLNRAKSYWHTFRQLAFNISRISQLVVEPLTTYFTHAWDLFCDLLRNSVSLDLSWQAEMVLCATAILSWQCMLATTPSKFWSPVPKQVNVRQALLHEINLETQTTYVHPEI